jgi:hypothetical protein
MILAFEKDWQMLFPIFGVFAYLQTYTTNEARNTGQGRSTT